MNPPRTILFLCVANSARSQMAEGLARNVFGDASRIESAGSAPSQVNPYAIRAMEEIGISLQRHTSKSVDTIDPSCVDLIVTLCVDEVCPAFFGHVRRLHWPLSDPDRQSEELSDQQRLEYFRVARDEIHSRIGALHAELGNPS